MHSNRGHALPVPVLPHPHTTWPAYCVDLRTERARHQEEEFVLSARKAELQSLLDEERLGRQEALLRQREEAERIRRGLQVR